MSGDLPTVVILNLGYGLFGIWLACLLIEPMVSLLAWLVGAARRVVSP